MKNQLKSLLEELKVADIPEKLEKLETYRSEILDWNKKVNITKIVEEDDFYRLHYIDSLMCTGSIEFTEAETVIDVGTGGGFPGIPMAIVFPEKRFTLLDSSRKRLNIIGELAEKLDINNIEIIHGRAEEVARQKKYREKFDLCVSRAVANLSTLSEYCLGFVKIGGGMIAYKGPGGYEEIENAEIAIETMGGFLDRVEDIDDISLKMEIPERHMWIYISKDTNTPSKYPRSCGKPQSNPIK